MPASNSAMKNFRAFAMPVRHALMSEMRIEVSNGRADEK
jgi:hypothetical protein